MRKFRMLDINLSTGNSEIKDVTELFDQYLGGTGVATALLSEMDPKLDAYHEEAPVIFATGPFSSLFPVATKTVALFKSPLSGNLGESHAGGRLAMAMFGAGFHVIRIRGKAKDLSYLSIEGDEVGIRQASSLQGMSALATERILREHQKSNFKRSVIRIGPAGERLSPMSCVTVDSSRHFGRLGLGGVFGSKNLKAIVISGGNYWKITERGRFNTFYSRLYKEVVESDVMKKYHDLGTPINVVPLSKINGLPTRNFSQGFFEGADGISGEKFAEKNLAQQIACAHCQCGCIHMGTVRECFRPEHNMYKTFKVSYDHELIFAWGSNLSIADSDEVLKLLQICEKQGWDAISMGVTLAWAVEAFQKGHIGLENTDGLVLNFGDFNTYEKILQRIGAAHNEFYSDLEKGAHFCGEKYGGLDFAIAFGKNEAPGYMTGLHSFLGYATGIRHSHLDSAGYSVDQKKINSEKSDADWTKWMYEESVWRMILNSLVICLFARNIYDADTIIEGLECLDIKGWNKEKLSEVAKKIHAMKTKFKLDCGFSFEKLHFPKRLEKVVTTCGQVTHEEFKKHVKIYQDMVMKDVNALEN